MSLVRTPRLRRMAAPVTLALLMISAVSAASGTQVAPTLPSDTLAGRRLPPEANVPRGVIAPTLPSDTLATPGDRGRDSSITRPVPSTPRLPAPADSTARDSTAVRDSAAPRAPQAQPAPQPAAPRGQPRIHPAAVPRLTLA